MRKLFQGCGRLAAFSSLCAGLLFGAGCASTPKVDWDGRVGAYTYDQAVMEMGPPDRSTKLADGTTVADWIVGRKPSFSVGLGVGSYGGHGGVAVGQGVTSGGQARILRLSFASDGQLTRWERP